MKHTLFVTTAAAAATIALAVTAPAQNPPPLGRRSPAPSGSASTSTSTSSSSNAGVSATDRKFAREAAKGGMMEVEMGRMAEQHASNSDVKQFGARMVTDHGKANSELKSIAAKKGIDLPGKASAESWKDDKTYMDMMVKDHEKDVAEFEKEAREGSDADLKQFADRTAAIIRKHLQMAKDIDGKLK